MINLTHRHCDSCGDTIAEGDLFFRSRTEIFAGNDQLPADLQNPNGVIPQVIAQLPEDEEQEILDEIYQEITFLLCPNCRLKLLELLGTMVNSGCSGCQSCGPKPKLTKKGKLLQFPPADTNDKE